MIVSNLLAYRIFPVVDGIIGAEYTGAEKAVVTNDYDTLFKYLTEKHDKTRVVWSLSEMVKLVFSILPPEAQSQLEEKQRNGYCATWQDNGYRYRIFYQPNKFFAINRRASGLYGDNEVTFFELDQFFPNEAEEEE